MQLTEISVINITMKCCWTQKYYIVASSIYTTVIYDLITQLYIVVIKSIKPFLDHHFWF